MKLFGASAMRRVVLGVSIFALAAVPHGARAAMEAGETAWDGSQPPAGVWCAFFRACGPKRPPPGCRQVNLTPLAARPGQWQIAAAIEGARWFRNA